MSVMLPLSLSEWEVWALHSYMQFPTLAHEPFSLQYTMQWQSVYYHVCTDGIGLCTPNVIYVNLFTSTCTFMHVHSILKNMYTTLFSKVSSFYIYCSMISMSSSSALQSARSHNSMSSEVCWPLWVVEGTASIICATPLSIPQRVSILCLCPVSDPLSQMKLPPINGTQVPVNSV